MSYENVILIGIVFILIGFILVIIGSILTTKTRVESGGVVFIGPFPIVWGTNKSMVLLAFILGITFLLILVLVNLLGR